MSRRRPGRSVFHRGTLPPGNFPEHEKLNNIYNIRVQTDEEGRYRLEGFRPYPSYTVEATHSSYAGAKVRKIDLRPRLVWSLSVECGMGQPCVVLSYVEFNESPQ